MSKEETIIRVIEVVKSPFAVSTEEGEELFKLITEKINQDQYVIIDFKDILLIVSTFLNASIGQLYGIYDTTKIQEFIRVQNMTQDDLSILKKVTDRAKDYFYNQRNFDDIVKRNFPDAE